MERPEKEKKKKADGKEALPLKKRRQWRKYIREVIIGDFLSSNVVYNNIPYLIFIAIIAIIYISNTYYAEKTFRQIEKTKVELKEIRFHHVAVKSALMYYSKLSEISKRVQPIGLKETIKPPYKIFFDRDSLENRTAE